MAGCSHARPTRAPDADSQPIHSFVLVPVFSEDGREVLGLRVNSGLTKGEGLFFVEWSLLTDIVDAVCVDGERSAVL